MKFIYSSLPRHDILCALFVIFFCLSFSLLLSAWVIGWELTESGPNVTFSEMLGENTTVQILYIIFWVVETWQLGSICFILLYYYTSISDVIKAESPHSENAYFALTYVYVALVFTKLVGFMGVFLFNANISSQHTAHYAMAAMGFISAALSSLVLLIRRFVFWNRAISSKWKDNIFLAFNTIYVLGIAAAAIVFGIMPSGIPEMTFSFTLQPDTLFLIYDIWKDPESYKNTRPVVPSIHLCLRPKRFYVHKMLRVYLEKKHFP